MATNSILMMTLSMSGKTVGRRGDDGDGPQQQDHHPHHHEL
jgi:hypothetical protein